MATDLDPLRFETHEPFTAAGIALRGTPDAEFDPDADGSFEVWMPVVDG